MKEHEQYVGVSLAASATQHERSFHDGIGKFSEKIEVLEGWISLCLLSLFCGRSLVYRVEHC